MASVYPQVLNKEFYLKLGDLLTNSFNKLTGRQLLDQIDDRQSLIHQLYDASLAILAHGTEPDPVFNFGNRVALDLFEYEWEEFIQLPSRMSAEPVVREERQRFLDEVTKKGFIENYSGVRISSSGRRFTIQNATVWNLVDDAGIYHGQAAAIAT